ncbi:MAG: hypothetical protein ACI4OS_07460 [Akkermansia sp.]
MAAPRLKTGGGPISGPLSLRPSGTAPARAVRLKGSDGKVITPKKPKAPEATAPTPEADDQAAAQAAAEQQAAQAAAEEAAAQAAAEEAAARAAQEEYERQMEEYNRQMEEYNRQMAEFQAAQEAAERAAAEQAAAEQAAAEQAAAEQAAAEQAAAAQAEKPKPAAAVKKPAAAVKKPAAAVKKPAAVAKPAAAKAAKPAAEPAPTEAAPTAEEAPAEGDAPAELSEEELAARDAYLQALQDTANATPMWKRLPFLCGVAAIVAMGTICSVVVVRHNAREARIKAHRDYINTLLVRAQSINQKGVETLADAKARQVDITCSLKDAKALLEVVVHPNATNEKGKPLYGGNAEGVAQNACLLLGLASEADDNIADLVFATMGKQAKVIRPTLFNWLIQRMAISDSKSVQKNFKKLADTIAAQPEWTKKNEILAYVWNGMGLRVTQSDVPAILGLLASDKTDSQLAKPLAVCLDNILEMMDDPAAKAALGDKIFENLVKLPEKKRVSNLRPLVPTLAKASSPKALAYYKKELENPAKWAKGQGLTFVGYWGDDSILDYILELQEKAPDDRAKEQVRLTIGSLFAQNRDRSDDVAEKIIGLYFDGLDADISRLPELIDKTDEASANYVGDDSPELPALKAELKKLEGLKTQKKQLINVLASLRDYPWVKNQLTKYTKDPDDDIQRLAKEALDKVEVNALNFAKRREAYQKRSK